MLLSALGTRAILKALASTKCRRQVAQRVRIIDRTIDELMEQYHLDRAAADELHDQLWMHTHGIAAMIATDYCDWDMSKAQRMLNRCQKALVREYEA